MKARVVVVLAALAVSGNARADAPCGQNGRPYVSVAGSITELPNIVSLMRAELAARQIDVCADAMPRGSPPLATVDVSAERASAVIAVEVNDRLTQKRVIRSVDLAGVPPDGRALTLAAAADELLRATWAELALTTAPAPAAAVPRAVETMVEEVREGPKRRAAPAAPAPWVGFTTMAALEMGTGGILYGGDVRVSVPAGQRFSGVARFGVREAPEVSGPDGSVHTSVILAGLGATLRTTSPRVRFALDVIGRVDAAFASYVGVANQGSVGKSRGGLGVIASGGVDAWVPLGAAVRFASELLLEVPMRPIRVFDAGRQVTAIAGVGCALGVGLGVVF
ncbi:MAG: hypothetical protein FWD17_00355 [Polyangiaceae bacterium]|nr:hypothetical protein [Polyangiaceae bacterium]